MKPIGIIVFPGTQCDGDTTKAFHSVGAKTSFIWHKDFFDHKNYEAVVVPGGFSYGDYLRAGALASKSRAIRSLIQANEYGIPILGICNGFQILCEAGLLPGILLKNEQLLFKDTWVELKLENASSYWGKDRVQNSVLPIAHSEGRYYASKEVLKDMEQNQQVWFTYKKNPNGSLNNIAGVLNKKKNIAALMPHPERAFEKWMGSSDGSYFFRDVYF